MPTSEELYARASALIPGGVNSPVRAFRAVGGTPPFIARGTASYLYDVEGKRYIDLVCSWGPLILGHCHPAVTDAVARALVAGTSFGAPTAGEVRLAELITHAVATIEKVRLVNSGTEAAMSAIRLARAFTGRDLVVKFEGCYHGHADGLLVKAGSGAATFGEADSPGIPASCAAQTAVLGYNDIDACRRFFQTHGDDIAAVIVEPVAGNMGVVPPRPGFLAALRALATEAGALLVFDEVITGFRVSYGGAQELFDVRPDLTVLGKIIGGGLPVGAFGGRAEIMDLLKPDGPVYQAGTLSGNPLAVAAGTAALNELQRPGTYERLERLGATLERGLGRAAAGARVQCTVQRVGSMLSMFLTGEPVVNFSDAASTDEDEFAAYFHKMLESGVYVAPSKFEAMFVSLAHTEKDVAGIVKAAGKAFRAIKD